MGLGPGADYPSHTLYYLNFITMSYTLRFNIFITTHVEFHNKKIF